MDRYKTRKIVFKELLCFGDWKVKVYMISKIGDFDYPEFYENVKHQLPKWLSIKNNFNSSNDKMAFIILHSGTEGIFTLANWWVGRNMLNTHIFITNHNEYSNFKRISGDGLAPCIWELEIINHERISWINNILKQMPQPKFNKYLNDIINIES